MCPDIAVLEPIYEAFGEQLLAQFMLLLKRQKKRFKLESNMIKQISLRLSTMALALLLTLTNLATAEEAIPTALDFASAERYAGTWVVTMEMQGNEMNFNLNVSEIDGKVGATIDSKMQPEPQAIEIVHETPEGLDFVFKLGFQGQQFTMHLVARESAGQLTGSLSEQNKIFSGEITGRKAKKEDLVQGRRGSPTETKIRIGDNQKIRVTFGNLKSTSDDYDLFQNVKTGDVFKFAGSRATKLFTDTDLVFGNETVKAHNFSENYPGVYSLWLKRTDKGWNLVFNEQPDIWGTQHKAEFDIAEVALDAMTLDEVVTEFIVKLEQNGGGGKLNLAWGNTQWSTPFSLSQ